MRTLGAVLCLIVVLSTLAVVSPCRPNICLSFSCGTCCAKDWWTCCDRQFEANKQAGMYNAATLRYQTPEEEAIETLGLAEETEPVVSDDEEEHESDTLIFGLPSFNVNSGVLKLSSSNLGIFSKYPRDYVYYAIQKIFKPLKCKLDCVSVYKIYQEHLKKQVDSDLDCLEMLPAGQVVTTKEVSHDWYALDKEGLRCYNTSDLIYTTKEEQKIDYLAQAAQLCFDAKYLTCKDLTDKAPAGVATKAISPRTLALRAFNPFDATSLMDIIGRGIGQGTILPVNKFQKDPPHNVATSPLVSSLVTSGKMSSLLAKLLQNVKK